MNFAQVAAPRRSIVPVDALAPLVAFLGLYSECGDRSRLETGQSNRFAGFLTIAVSAFLNSTKRLFDFSDQLALAVARAEFQRSVSF